MSTTLSAQQLPVAAALLLQAPEVKMEHRWVNTAEVSTHPCPPRPSALLFLPPVRVARQSVLWEQWPQEPQLLLEWQAARWVVAEASAASGPSVGAAVPPELVAHTVPLGPGLQVPQPEPKVRRGCPPRWSVAVLARTAVEAVTGVPSQLAELQDQ